MRLLLDQAVPVELAPVLEALSHAATHVSALGLARAPDAHLALIARDYDVFVTLDLHRQEGEWLAIYAEIAGSGVKVLRIRLAKREHNEELRLAVIRQVLQHMERWVEAFSTGGAALVTVGPSASRFSSRSADEVRDMLVMRQTRRSRRPSE